MKLLAASDLHGDVGAAEKLAKKAKDEKVDLVILAGDLSIFGEGLEGLLKPFKNANKKVALIPGNHDSEADIFLLKQRYSDMVYDMHNYAFTISVFPSLSSSPKVSCMCPHMHLFGLSFSIISRTAVLPTFMLAPSLSSLV